MAHFYGIEYILKQKEVDKHVSQKFKTKKKLTLYRLTRQLNLWLTNIFQNNEFKTVLIRTLVCAQNTKLTCRKYSISSLCLWGENIVTNHIVCSSSKFYINKYHTVAYSREYHVFT